MQTPGEQCERLFDMLYLPQEQGEAVYRLETAFLACVEAEAVLGKIKKAMRKRDLPKMPLLEALEPAARAGILTMAEVEQVRAAEKLRADAIAVDGFSHRDYERTAAEGGWDDDSSSQGGSMPTSSVPAA